MIKRFTISGLTVIGPVNDLRLAANIESALAKTAGFKGEIVRDAEGNVDLKAEMAKRPTALWVRAKAIEADKENDNGDFFPLDELRASYKTFEGVPIFCNHENNDVAKAKGKVVLAEWDEAEKSVYCTFFVDREAHAPICRAIEEGIITDVSMGTQVDYSTCSDCNNRATDASSYCDHVKTMKGRMMGGKKVYEKNYGLKFIELSLVTDGACQSCTIQEVIEPEEALSRAAAAIGIVKTGLPNRLAGQEEIKSLNDAMALLETVSRKMLDQRKYLDMEFLSKLVDVLADLQEVTDELVDQGYGSLGGAGAGGMTQEPVIPPLPTSNDQKGQGMEQANPVSAGPADLGIGTVTEPTVATSPDARTVAYKVQDLRQRVQKIYQQAQESQGGQKVSKPNETISKVAMIWDNPSIRNFKAEMNDGDYRVIVGSDEIYGMKGGTKIASVKVADLEPEQRQQLRTDTQAAMDEMLKAFKAKYAGTTVLAEKAPSNSAEQQTMTMELQLESQRVPLHPRTKDVRESVTEVQLDSKATGYDQHARQEDPKDSITQKQLDNDPGYQARQGKERDQTMEGQLRDTGIKANSNPADGKGSAAGVKDQSQQVTEGQLGEWKSAEKLHHPTQITEKQLAEQAQPWGRRIASKEDANLALAAAMKAMVRTAKALGVTPEEILSVVRHSTNSIQAQVDSIKVAVASAGNKEARETLLKRASFHGHTFTASKDDIKSYLFGSLIDAGFEPELGLMAVAEIAREKSAASSIADAIMAAAKQPESDENEFERLQRELFGSSLRDMIKGDATGEDDITVVLDNKQVSADPSDHEKFAKEAFEKARKYASLKGYEVTKDVEVSQNDKGISVTVRGKKVEAKKEEAVTSNRKEIRRKLVEAQFGGAAGGGPAAAGGAPPAGMDAAGPVGTTVPGGGMGGMGGAPVPGAAPVQSFGQDEPIGPEDELEPEGGEALPPGSICPACGSDDVDVKSGEFNCNGCGAEGTISVKIEVVTWPDSIEEKSPDKGDEVEGEEMGAEAAPGGAGGIPMPEVGLAASFKVTPEMVKLAGNKPVGSFCPHCGSDKVKLSATKDHHVGKCSKCAGAYRIDAYVDANNPRELMARIAWKDRNVVKAAKARIAAASIKSKKAKLVAALKKSKLEQKFAKADVAGKAHIIAKLADQGLIEKEQ